MTVKMRAARDVIAEVPDFWMEDKGDDSNGMDLGIHNAERIMDALHKAGYVIIRDRTDPEGGIPGRTAHT